MILNKRRSELQTLEYSQENMEESFRAFPVLVFKFTR